MANDNRGKVHTYCTDIHKWDKGKNMMMNSDIFWSFSFHS